MGLAKDLNAALHRELGCHVAWAPVANTFALGDYGVISNGVFTKLGVAADFSMPIVAKESPGASSKLSSANTRVASMLASDGDTSFEAVASSHDGEADDL